MKTLWLVIGLSLSFGGLVFPAASGLQRGRGGRGDAPLLAQAAAPIDLTGYWVSVVTEDWRWRMATPQKGDYQSLPLNALARKVADSWDLAKDEASGNQCKPYGVGSLIRQPGRLHITWENENALRIDFDAGTQTRLLHFGMAASASSPSLAEAAGPKTWQGVSTAVWERPGRSNVADLRVSDTAGSVPGGGGAGLRGAPPRSATLFEGGSLKVTTTDFRDGYLRTNGVPYSENASLTEHFDRLPPHPNGDVWLVVSSILEDPQYLNGPLYLSTHFKKEPDGSKWNPTPCKTDPPGTVRARSK